MARISFIRQIGILAGEMLVVANIPTNVAVASNDQVLGAGGILSDNELKKVVTADILERNFLVTGNLTPAIYRSTATFTDEIDTYEMKEWMRGTQQLFVGDKSRLRLVGDVQVSKDKVEFRFDEDLMFRIPFRPVVSLTGRVVLQRDDRGYITSYREFWDQDVWSVIKTAKFNL